MVFSTKPSPNALTWLKTRTDKFRIERQTIGFPIGKPGCKTIGGDRITSGDIIMNFHGCKQISFNDWTLDVSEFEADKFPIPIICLPYVIIKPHDPTEPVITCDVVYIDDVKVREEMKEQRFGNDKYLTKGGGFMHPKAWCYSHDEFIDALSAL